MGPTDGLNTLAKRPISFLCKELNHDSSEVTLTASSLYVNQNDAALFT
jgi:hypothetical protein